MVHESSTVYSLKKGDVFQSTRVGGHQELWLVLDDPYISDDRALLPVTPAKKDGGKVMLLVLTDGPVLLTRGYPRKRHHARYLEPVKSAPSTTKGEPQATNSVRSRRAARSAPPSE